jgi:UDP-N-acetylglucosamine:LPS N-acetylglucosamine transferase
MLRYAGEVLFVKGIVEKEQKKEQIGNVTCFNFMKTSQLELAFAQSEIILCRSGYTTVMDLAKLEKKAFFIPTPGQYEQEYLAIKLEKEGLVPYATQDNFKIENLSQIANYKGLPKIDSCINWGHLFEVF